jgi:putative peptidoglycan lipid II flippase
LQVRIRIPGRSDPQLDNRAAALAQPHLERETLGGSSRVALGILASRLTGLLRERVIGHYLGVDSIAADAFRAAIRIPNLLNNLFGEGVLSASFVTVYAKLRATGEDEEAEDLAAAVFGALSLVCSALVLLGVWLTPMLIDVIAPGFEGPKRALTTHLVRILFPGTGLLVMSAWCLGVLNSHRRFLLPYLAPVVLNATVIVVALTAGRRDVEEKLVVDIAWGVVLGSALQFLVQLPRVLALLPGFRPQLDLRSVPARNVFSNFGPIFLSRGVVQISAYVDQIIASWLPLGSVAAMGYGQVIATLPISLFSMSVSAAELPALSSAVGSREEIARLLQTRLTSGLRRISFFIIPSAVAFLLLGDILAAALYQSGRFHHADAVWVWAVLAGSAIGLLASALGRLYSSAFYALLDTATPLRFALIRVTLTTVLGFLFALRLPGWLGIEAKWGVAGLTASAGLAGWVEFALLRQALGKRIGSTALPADFAVRLWAVAFLSGLAAYLLKRLLGPVHPIAVAAITLSFYGVGYFWGASLLGVSEGRAIPSAIFRRLRRLL